MGETRLKEFDSSRYGDIRKSLIKEKGSETQIQFLEATLSNSKFIKWIRDELDANASGAKQLTLFPRKLTESEFKDSPPKVEKKAFEAWSELTPSIACRSEFWACATLNHIEKGIIDSSFLAAPSNSSISGLTRIDTALAMDRETAKGKKAIDDVTRTILRRFSGLPEARGGLRSIYVNCSFGKAWWRERIIDQTLEVTKGDRDAVTRTLHQSQEYWEKLVNVLSSRNSVFGDGKVRSTLIWALSTHIDDKKYKNFFLARGAIDRCMDLLGVYSAIQEFGVFEIKELREFIEKYIIDATIDTPSDDGGGGDE